MKNNYTELVNSILFTIETRTMAFLCLMAAWLWFLMALESPSFHNIAWGIGMTAFSIFWALLDRLLDYLERDGT